MLSSREFNRLMKYATMNDDPKGVLGSIYDSSIPHPYFDPANIAFSHLRSYEHGHWSIREKSNRIIVYQDLEFIIPGEQFYWKATRTPPCLEQDKLVLSYSSINDHLWPCEYAFSSWHLVQTNLKNINTFVEQKDSRPYFADILLGNLKNMRQTFFDLLKANNQLENNLINAFGVYKTPFLDEGNGDIDIWFRNLDTSKYVNTTDQFQDSGFASQFISKHILEATWVSVVAETLDDNILFFPTEKTGKALISGKPFLVLSGKHYLKNLRKLGFRTFHPFIDEDYDEIDDATERTKKVMESFITLQQKDQTLVRKQLQEILEHNEKCMRNKEWLSRQARAMLDPLITIV